MKILAILLLVPVFVFADQNDVSPGLDPTSLTTISAAQLLQLASGKVINSGSSTNGKGMIFRSSIAPNLTAVARMTNWLWLDISTGPPGTLKQWDGSTWVAAALGSGSVLASNLAPGSVTQPALATNAVDTINIVNSAVTSAKIGAAQVLNTHLGSMVVSNVNIADRTITGAKIATQTIENTNIVDGTITGSKLAPGTLGGSVIADYSITESKMATNSVGLSNIIAGAVGNAQLTNNAVTTNKIAFTGASALQVLQVDSSATFVGWATPILSKKATLNVGVLGTAQSFTNAHGLGGVPLITRCVLTNTAPNLGYNIGDEVNIDSPFDNGVASFTVASDSVNVYVTMNATALVITTRDTGLRAGIDQTKWGIKAYAFR